MVTLPQNVRGVLRLAAVGLALLGCGPSNAEPVVPRSAHVPPPRTADGRVVGADNKSPEQLLSEQGTTAHAAPGWKVDKKGVSYDPKRSPGDPDPGATRLERPDGGTETLPSQPPRPTP